MNPLGARTRSQGGLDTFRKPHCHNVASFLNGHTGPRGKGIPACPNRALWGSGNNRPRCKLIYQTHQCRGVRVRADLCRRHYDKFCKFAVKCGKCGALNLLPGPCGGCVNRTQRVCVAEGCSEHKLVNRALGYCMKHYKAHKRKGLAMPLKSNRSCITAAAVLEFIQSSQEELGGDCTPVLPHPLAWAGDDSEVTEEIPALKRGRGEISEDGEDINGKRRRQNVSVDVEDLRKFMATTPIAVVLTG